MQHRVRAHGRQVAAEGKGPLLDHTHRACCLTARSTGRDDVRSLSFHLPSGGQPLEAVKAVHLSAIDARARIGRDVQAAPGVDAKLEPEP